MKIANIDKEILHNFWTTWGISMKFSGNMCLMIILKVTKNQGFTLCLEDTIFKKPQGRGQIDTLPPAVLGLNKSSTQRSIVSCKEILIKSDSTSKLAITKLES